MMSTSKVNVEKTIVLYSEQGLTSRKADLKCYGNKNNMLLFIVLVSFFKGERNAMKCTSFFPAGQTPVPALSAAGSLGPSVGTFPAVE